MPDAEVILAVLESPGPGLDVVVAKVVVADLNLDRRSLADGKPDATKAPKLLGNAEDLGVLAAHIELNDGRTFARTQIFDIDSTHETRVAALDAQIRE